MRRGCCFLDPFMLGPRFCRHCVDRMLEFYTGAACSLCDPDWTRYSTQQPGGAWVVTVREENCHYLWAACSKVPLPRPSPERVGEATL